MDIGQNIKSTLETLVGVPSISGTHEENQCVEEINKIFMTMDYFKKNPHKLKNVKVEGDSLKRNVVFAELTKNQASKDYIILTGHYDVVDILEYGELKPEAFNMKKCTENIDMLPLGKDAKKDFLSGDYYFGRGSADMKYGLALYIELIRYLSEDEEFIGNLLFIAVPGEESNSEGMLEASKYLEKLQEKGYNFKGLFLSECSIPEKAGDESKKIYLGTCGKIMPLFLFAGKESHVCEPFDGLNANLLASEVNRLMEGNYELCDENLGEKTPVPVCLYQRDLKELYSVQVPLYAAAYYNLLTLKKSPLDIMKKLKEICNEAFVNTIHIVNKNYEGYYGHKKSSLEPNVITYKELYKKVYSDLGERLPKLLNEKLQEFQLKGMSLQDKAVLLLKYLFDLNKDKKPSVVIAFMPPFYPHKYLHNDEFLSSIDKIIEYAKKDHSIDIIKKNYFMGICDLSYTGFSEESGINDFYDNLIGKEMYNFPIDSIKKLNIPSVVFGGFGKDFHKYSERLNISYSIDVVPDLYIKILKDMFRKQ